MKASPLVVASITGELLPMHPSAIIPAEACA
jgi:hypothetical protein